MASGPAVKLLALSNFPECPCRFWLALDVDGPIALMGAPEPAEVFERIVEEIPLLISRRLPERLRRLSGVFQIVWASSWGKRASLKIGLLRGLPAGLPYIPFTAAVVDDEVGPDMWEWAQARPHTLMLQIDPRFGLLDEHVEQLLQFAKSF